MQSTRMSRILMGTIALVLLAGCAPASYQVKSPLPSALKYEASAQAAKNTYGLVDKRAENDRTFSSGRLPAALTIGDVEIDPPKFLSQSLQEELAARGISDSVTLNAQQTPRIDLRTFSILNHRATGFSPFVTLTFLAVDMESGSNKTRIGVFIKRGKVPVWSFEEVVEPTFNQPLSLVVKELAAKVVSQQYGYRASDAAVDALIQKVATRGEEAYLDVYALGFSNNPKAVDTLVKLTKDQDEYVRLAAISSLGNMRATSQFDLLSSIYRNRENIWQDRAMALKAIGDLGTAESKKLLADELRYWDGQSQDNEAKWTSQIIRLYL